MRTTPGNAAVADAPLRRRFAATAIVCAALVVAVLTGCGGTPAATSSVDGSVNASGMATGRAAVRIATLKGPTGVGMVHLMAAQQAGTATNDYTFTVTDSPEEVAAKVASGDVDIAAVPTNLGAALYAKTSGGVQMLAVNTLGVMYVVEKGTTVSTIAQLRGRTIVASGQGSTPSTCCASCSRRPGSTPTPTCTSSTRANTRRWPRSPPTAPHRSSCSPSPS